MISVNDILHAVAESLDCVLKQFLEGKVFQILEVVVRVVVIAIYTGHFVSNHRWVDLVVAVGASRAWSMKRIREI